MTREQAIYYLQSSGFSEEQIATIERAFKQEPSGDLISRQAVQDYIAKYLSQYLYDDVREAVEVIDEYIGGLPSVNPQEPKTGALEKIRAEIEQTVDEEQKYDEKWAIGLRYAVKIIDKHIKEYTE